MNTAHKKASFYMIQTQIDKWDPIDMFPHAPADEYENEVALLKEFIRANKVTRDTLAEEIHRVFTNQFGKEVFKCNKAECNAVAEKIIEQLATQNIQIVR